MNAAISEAEKAFEKGEVPIGAVIIRDNRIVSKAHNRVEQETNAILHAEILAIKQACTKLNSKYLSNCSLFVTVEPCQMCAGAIINSRISNVFFGIFEPKTGACGTVYNSFAHDNAPNIYSGILAEECKSLMQLFFNKLRS